MGFPHIHQAFGLKVKFLKCWLLFLKAGCLSNTGLWFLALNAPALGFRTLRGWRAGSWGPGTDQLALFPDPQPCQAWSRGHSVRSVQFHPPQIEVPGVCLEGTLPLSMGFA